MYIQPNTIVKVLNGVPLDEGYENTIYFDSVSAQQSYFNSMVKYTFPKCSYQRKDRDYVAVEMNAENLYNCNYIMFQNTSFGSKWFFGFITGIEYANNNMSYIYYKIDVMQTWFFEMELRQCFVEREHSLTDEIDENINYEGLEIGEYITKSTEHYNDFEDMSVVIYSPYDIEGNQVGEEVGVGGYPVYPNVIQSVPLIGGYYTVFNCSTLRNPETNLHLGEWIKKYGGVDTIISSFMCPTILTENIPAIISLQGTIDNNVFTDTKTITRDTSIKRLDGRSPKNKKLYSYPYSVFTVCNNQGAEKEFRYELFNKTHGISNFKFNVYGAVGTSPTIVIAPQGYKSRGFDYTDLDYALSLSNFPQTPYNIDTFKNWQSQQMSRIGSSAITQGISLATTYATGGFAPSLSSINGSIAGGYSGSIDGLIKSQTTRNLGVGAINSGASVLSDTSNLITNSLLKATNPSAIPSNVGNAGSDGYTLLGANRYTFDFKKLCITPEYTTIIDDFFSKYGYKTQTLKTPNISSRPYWNYVKTIGCIMDGDIPADDKQKMCDVFDNGVTFWKNGNYIGDYEYDNTPN